VPRIGGIVPCLAGATAIVNAAPCIERCSGFKVGRPTLHLERVPEQWRLLRRSDVEQSFETCSATFVQESFGGSTARLHRTWRLCRSITSHIAALPLSYMVHGGSTAQPLLHSGAPSLCKFPAHVGYASLEARHEAATLRSLLHTGGISIAGLTTVLDAVNPAAAPSNAALRSCNMELFTKVRKVLRLPLSSGGHLDWEILDMTKLLPSVLDTSDALRSLYEDAHVRRPSSSTNPWPVVVACDEFAPGNKLNVPMEHPTLLTL
jgi:hypothetical protein